MNETIENIAPDLKLIEEVIIELRLSTRNIAIYPRDHPTVQNSLNRIYNVIKKIFELRPEITLAVGKDTFIIENYSPDKKNAAYKQLAEHLRGLNIAFVCFSPGLTLDELYNFQRCISAQGKDLSPKDIRETLGNCNLSHIDVGFIDYEAFSFEEGKTVHEIPQKDLLENYILDILGGKLKIEEISEEIGEFPLDTFSRLLDRLYEDGIDKTTSKKIIAIYIKKFFQRPFSNKEIKKLLAFVNELPQDLKEQFLSTVIDSLSKDIISTEGLLRNISADLIIQLFETIRSNNLSIPENLGNLLDTIWGIDQKALEYKAIGDNFLIDDIFLPSHILDKLSKSNLKGAISDSFETSVSDDYQKEIKKLIEFDSEIASIRLPDLKKEIDDDFIEKTFNLIILEIMSSNLISQEEYLQFIEKLKGQTAQFIWTGQYAQVLQIVKLLKLNVEKNIFSDITSEALQYYYSQEFFLAFIDSLKVMGRQARDEAWQLCEYYSEMIIPSLMDTLINEDSQTFRSLLIGFIKQFGDIIITEALKRLDDTRWFVKRNILYLLTGCKNKEIIPYVRQYCHHENRKVSFEALKCLLSLEDHYVIDVLKKYILSESAEEVEQSIALSSAFRTKEMVPDLIQMLRKKGSNKTDLLLKIAIIQALGNIGDLVSLPAFREVVFSKSLLFFKGGLDNLKVEIFKTLKNYPYKDIEDIVKVGLKSKNEYIKSESLRLSNVKAR
jgi:HEAT repeat protein